MDKVLVICGPTATGKTALGLRIAGDFDGEIISADSRQAHTGLDIITGKDLPPGFKKLNSGIFWHDRYLTYYSDGRIRIWLLDIAPPDENFNVSFWLECAILVINDIHQRKKLPIVAGGSGLYLKALTSQLSQISIPPDPVLRQKLQLLSVIDLFNYLNSLDPAKAVSLNNSDKNNPRRLIRYIEIAQSSKVKPDLPLKTDWDIKKIGLTAPRAELFRRIDLRVSQRLEAGAANEDPVIAGNPDKWRLKEHRLALHQLTWFKKQSGITWFDISSPRFQLDVSKQLDDWYNQNR